MTDLVCKLNTPLLPGIFSWLCCWSPALQKHGHCSCRRRALQEESRLFYSIKTAVVRLKLLKGKLMMLVKLFESFCENKTAPKRVKIDRLWWILKVNYLNCLLFLPVISTWTNIVNQEPEYSLSFIRKYLGLKTGIHWSQWKFWLFSQ